MAKTKRVNAIDNLIDVVAKTILNVKTANLVLEDPDSLRFLDFFIKHTIDLQRYIGLFKIHYLPAATRSTFEAKKQIASSKYKSYLNFTKEDTRENVHETILLGYVGLYYKLESFVEGLGNQRQVIKETYLSDEDKHYEDFFKFLLSEFDLLRTDLKKDVNPRISRIRLICNKVKHDDGLISGPNDNLLNHMPGLIPDTKRRIRVSAEQFLMMLITSRIFLETFFNWSILFLSIIRFRKEVLL